MDLPVNVIIILIVSVLVLVIVSAMFITQTFSNTNTVSNEYAYTYGCSQLLNPLDGTGSCCKELGEIKISNYGTLMDACTKIGMIKSDTPDDITKCKKSCGCSITALALCG